MEMSQSAEDVASIVVRCDGEEFIRELAAADTYFEQFGFESTLADFLRLRPQLVDPWVAWSEDQRWTPSAYVRGTETGWYDDGYRAVANHPDEAAAVADFIHRLASWLAARHVVVPTKPERDS